MILYFIGSARKRRSKDCYVVLHPSNDAILATCSTSKEADQIIAELNSFVYGQDRQQALERSLADKSEQSKRKRKRT